MERDGFVIGNFYLVGYGLLVAGCTLYLIICTTFFWSVMVSRKGAKGNAKGAKPAQFPRRYFFERSITRNYQ